jgi:hypothetical protein
VGGLEGPDWINHGNMLEKRALLMEQLRRDPELLKQANAMDYSLLSIICTSKQ